MRTLFGRVAATARRCRRTRRPPTAPNSAAPRAGISFDVGHVHLAAAGVGEQLHHQRAALGDPAAGDDLGQLEPVLLEVVHDPPAAERDRLEQRAVDLARAWSAASSPKIAPVRSASARIVRLPFHQSSATSPVSPGRDLGRRALELARSCRRRMTSVVDEPREHVADRRLPGLVAVQPGQDPVLDDAGDPGQPDLLGVDDHVADRGPDHDHERARAPRRRRPGTDTNASTLPTATATDSGSPSRLRHLGAQRARPASRAARTCRRASRRARRSPG